MRSPLRDPKARIIAGALTILVLLVLLDIAGVWRGE
jgi:uncharacterized membrane protein YqjE